MVGLFYHLLPGSQPADVGWALAGAPAGCWLKVADCSLVAVARNLGARVYLRPCFLPGDDGEGDCQDGATWAAKVVAAIQASGGTWPDCCGFRNECHATAANAAEYQRYRSALRAAGYRGLVVYGSFAVGQPDWPAYATIPADADAVEYHEYVDLTLVGSSPWWALRHTEAYRRGLIPLTTPIFIGEHGSDRIPDPDDHSADPASIEDGAQRRRGWQDRGKLSADDQATNLRSYAASCLPNVQAAFVFSDGNEKSHDWDSYRTRGTPLEAVIRGTWQGGPSVKVIDVSSAQTGTDWTHVAAAGMQAGLVKASEGVGWPSPTFAADWQGIAAAGMARGTYHYARPELGNDPAAEARYFLSVVGPLAVGDVLALDIEVGNGDLGAWANAWFRVVDAALGAPALLYSYAPFLEAHGLTMAAVGKRPLWLAAYQDQEPAAPLDWPAVTLWQYTSAGVVPGVATPCDCDATALDAAGFRALGKPAPPGPSGVEAEAYAWYTQRGVAIDRSHALWAATLLPLYARWRDMAAAGDPLSDAYHPGPALEPEYGTTFGGNRPAGAIRLTNATYGAYLTDAGVWRAYAAER